MKISRKLKYNRIAKKVVIFIIISLPCIIFPKNNNKLIKINDITTNEKVEYFFFDKKIIDYFPYKILSKKEFKEFLKRYAVNILPIEYSEIPQYTDFNDVEIKISSSSFLKEGGRQYKPKYAFDKKLSTVWVEGVRNFGYKEWIKFYFTSKKKIIHVNYVIIYPGHGRSEKLFYLNNRVKSLIMKSYSPEKISFSDDVDFEGYSSIIRLNFQDIKKYHVFLTHQGYMSSKKIQYTFYIEDVYKGSKYNDTCIAEIIFADGLDIPLFRP
ncbi:MAG: hypothetical protein SVR08_15760 [Spirochaetota bacterium]|nr:hypothetical protein [Spirochaetota bacterium]